MFRWRVDVLNVWVIHHIVAHNNTIWCTLTGFSALHPTLTYCFEKIKWEKVPKNASLLWFYLLNKRWHYMLFFRLFLLIIWCHYILYLNVLQKFLHRVSGCWCTVAVCCAESGMLIPELLYESVQPFHLMSRPQPSCLISAWLWWTHAPSVLGRTVFWRNLTKTATVIGWTHTCLADHNSKEKSHSCTNMIKHEPLFHRLMFFMSSRWDTHYKVSSSLKLVKK